MQTTATRIVSLCVILMVVPCWSAMCAGEQAITLTASSAKVGKYEKIEFVIFLDAQYENPFDPDEVDLTLLLTTPSGTRLSIPAFSCQDYQRRRLGEGRTTREWLYPGSPPVWKARFAPRETGTYLAMARLKDRRGTSQSEAVRFESAPSQRKGFLRVSTKDPRFLEFTEGEPFFAIGQNLAFIGAGQRVDLPRAEEIFTILSKNGANFLRVWTCCKDWAMAIEARKSVWGRSWAWRPPLAPMPEGVGGRSDRQCVKIEGEDGKSITLQPCHPLAVQAGTRYVLSGKVKTDGKAKLRLDVHPTASEEPLESGPDRRWTSFRREFTTGPNELWLNRISLRLEGAGSVLLDGLSLQEAGGGPELLWEADVNRPRRGRYNPVDCYMLDRLVEAAEKEGIYLQLCLITRDLYMDSLKDPQSPEYRRATEDAKKLLRYAVARWGYSTSVAAWEYFNEMDPGSPTDQFYAELGEYLEKVDVYGHLRTTSTWHPSPKDMRHPKLDIAQSHFYLRPSSEKRLKDEVDAVPDQVRLLREHAPGKPALIGEFGLANEKWQPRRPVNQDDQLADFHNALWASALSGTSGTVLFWWWDKIEAHDGYHHYRPLAAFLADVPWTTAGLQKTSATISGGGVRLLGLQGKDRAYLWLFNPQASWLKVADKKQVPSEIRDARLEIRGLPPGDYRVQWWDTYQGKALREQDVSFAEPALKLTVPAFSRDTACKITPRR